MSYLNLEQIGFKDSPQLDAFGRLRVSAATTLFDSQQEYGLSSNLWATSISGAGSSVAMNANTRMTEVTCGTGASDKAILQSIQYVRYIPGKSHFIVLTGVFSPGTVANNVCRAGYFDYQNGVFLQVAGGVESVVRRSSVTGSTVDEVVTRANWSVDKFDGLGPSGKTLDLTKAHILYITAQWLGEGRIEIGFDIEGVLFPAHRFLIAGILDVPSTQTFNLPVRMESQNTGVSAGAVVKFNCCSVQSEGGFEPRGALRTVNMGTTSLGVTARRPVISIRPAATFNGFVNRAHIEGKGVSFHVTTNDILWELVFSGTLTGASFASVGVNSIAEVDTAATAISGGIVLASGYAVAGQGSFAGLTSNDFDIRTPLVIRKIDNEATVQPPISIVITSLSGTANILAEANWFEQFL